MFERYHIFERRFGVDNQFHKWEYERQGERVTLRFRQQERRSPPPGCRGAIGTFSKGSRRRLMRFVAQIDWEKTERGMFITLTYPDDVAHNDKEKRNRERYLFLRHVEAFVNKNICGIWRVEYQPRKSGIHQGHVLPHIHMLLIGVKFIPYDLFRVWWASAIGTKENPMVNVKQFKNAKRVLSYMSKYIGKEIDPIVKLDEVTYLNTGRHYGYHRRSEIPQCKVLNFPLLDASIIHWVRVVAGTRLKYLDLDYFETFSLFGELTVKIAQTVEGKYLTGEVWHPTIGSALGGESP